MEEFDDYYKDDIMLMIRSGFYSVEDIAIRMEDLDLPQAEMESFIEENYKRHQVEHTSSKHVILLQHLFDELSAEGYVALHNAGYTGSDVDDAIDEVLEKSTFKPYGYIAYHEQDLNRCIDSGEFTLAFGAFADTEQTQYKGLSKQQTGYYFKSKLEAKGFNVDWDGDTDKKLTILNFEYIKTYDNEDWSLQRCLDIMHKQG